MFFISEVRINKGGYDRDGQYWGIGQRLFAYYYMGDNPELSIYEQRRHFRADDRNEAKMKIRHHFKSAFPDHLVFAR